MDAHANGGLPRNLSGAAAERAAINHGFKAVQIGVSAWTAEALKGTMPASVFRGPRRATIKIRLAWERLRLGTVCAVWN